MVNKIIPYKGQSYSDLKKHHQEEESLFIDATFPALDGIIGTSSIPANIVWKRPGEISKGPRLFKDVESSKIVRAGEFSCNWMVSACAILAGVNEVRNKVIPDYWDQEWGEKNYCGIFHFRFWRFGNWTDVVVDDFLPTVENVLLTTQAGSENEFWAALVEKAYVKLHGSYDGLREGELSDALVDFTGGVSEVIDLRAGRYSEIEDKRTQLFDLLHKETVEHSITCFTVSAPSLTNIGERTELGLMKGHTYHMTDIKKVYLGETTLRSLFNGREKVAMVRLRDPREEEKKPPGSPDSALSSDASNPFAYSTESLSRLRSRNSDWQQIKDNERQRIGLIFRDPSEFWMPLEDVVAEFSEVTICRLVSENFFAKPGKKWKGSSVKGVWETGPKDTKLDRSGGGDINEDSFLRNPQDNYTCQLRDEQAEIPTRLLCTCVVIAIRTLRHIERTMDIDGKLVKGFMVDINGDAEIMIQLLQYQEDEPTPNSNLIHQLIGFHIVRVENNRNTRMHKIWTHNPIVVAEDHKRKREIVYRGQLAEGKYVIIPTTYREGDVASFLLRIFSQDDVINLKEMKEDVPRNRIPCSCLFPEVQWVTVITVESAELEHRSQQWGSSRINPYCTIICEGNKVKTAVARDDSQPEWNASFIFFRKKINKPLMLRVFTKNSLFPNELLGECELPAAITHSPTPLDASLMIKQKTKDDTEMISAGTIHLSILTEDNLYAV